MIMKKGDASDTEFTTSITVEARFQCIILLP